MPDRGDEPRIRKTRMLLSVCVDEAAHWTRRNVRECKTSRHTENITLNDRTDVRCKAPDVGSISSRTYEKALNGRRRDERLLLGLLALLLAFLRRLGRSSSRGCRSVWIDGITNELGGVRVLAEVDRHPELLEARAVPGTPHLVELVHARIARRGAGAGIPRRIFR